MFRLSRKVIQNESFNFDLNKAKFVKIKKGPLLMTK